MDELAFQEISFLLAFSPFFFQTYLQLWQEDVINGF